MDRSYLSYSSVSLEQKQEKCLQLGKKSSFFYLLIFYSWRTTVSSCSEKLDPQRLHQQPPQCLDDRWVVSDLLASSWTLKVSHSFLGM